MRAIRFGLFSTFIFAVGVAVSPAGAQDTQAAPAAPAAQPAAPAEASGGIEEIIVTAQKREQSAQEVPIAITAISAELQTGAIRDLRDLNGFAASAPRARTTTPSTRRSP
jgi:outer membrane receptor protein involved in Fe transport